jgi:hypothetical protein
MSRFIMPRQGVKGQNLSPSDGAKLYFYEVGTSTPKDTYTDAAKSVASSNPVVADAKGVFAYIEIDGSYDVTLKDKNDNIYWSAETINEIIDGSEIANLTVNTATVAAMKVLTGLTTGTSVVETAEFYSTTGGGGTYDIIAGTGTANGQDIIAHDTLSLSFVLRETQGWNLIAQYGGLVSSDISAILTAIKTKYKGLLIDNGTWLAKDITLNSSEYIGLRSRSAVLSGVASGDDIFVSSGAVSNVYVQGGRFNLCNNAFYHTGDSALASSVFVDTLYTNCNAGFDLSSAVGLTFKDNKFGVGSASDNIAYGVRFRKTGTGQTNVNNFYANRYSGYSVAGVSYDDEAQVAVANTHYGDWWEDSDHSGLKIGGGTSSLTLYGGYFETTGSITESDIELTQSVGGSITDINFKDVKFLTSVAAQTSRIKSTGNAEFKAIDCGVTLGTSQVFAEVNSSGGPFHIELFSNRLNAVGAGTYESRLFTKSGSQQVSWSTHVGSGLVTDDDYPKEVKLGVVAYPWVTFTTTDATPSVRQGLNFKTAGTTTITTFDDGTDGQLITVKAGNTITVVGVAMVLDDVAQFINDGGTWRHINL